MKNKRFSEAQIMHCPNMGISGITPAMKLKMAA